MPEGAARDWQEEAGEGLGVGVGDAFTVRLKLAVRVSPPPVPVTVMPDVPVGVVALVLRVRVVVQVGVQDVGEEDAVVPVGSPDAENATEVLVVDCPLVTVPAPPFDIEKLNVPGLGVGVGVGEPVLAWVISSIPNAHPSVKSTVIVVDGIVQFVVTSCMLPVVIDWLRVCPLLSLRVNIPFAVLV